MIVTKKQFDLRLWKAAARPLLRRSRKSAKGALLLLQRASSISVLGIFLAICLEMVIQEVGFGATPEKKVSPAASTAKLPSLQEHWAFRAPVRPAEPKVKNTKWARNSIDRFVLARLEKEKLSPSPEADRVTLIRRL